MGRHSRLHCDGKKNNGISVQTFYSLLKPRYWALFCFPQKVWLTDTTEHCFHSRMMSIWRKLHRSCVGWHCCHHIYRASKIALFHVRLLPFGLPSVMLKSIKLKRELVSEFCTSLLHLWCYSCDWTKVSFSNQFTKVSNFDSLSL